MTVPSFGAVFMSRNVDLCIDRTYHIGLPSFSCKLVHGPCYAAGMDDDQVIDPATARALQIDAARAHALSGWIVMRDPPDYPDKFAARLVVNRQTPYVLVADSLDGLRAMLRPVRLKGTESRHKTVQKSHATVRNRNST